MPADKDIVTVKTITMVAKTTDRVKDPLKSPTLCSLNNSVNQCKDIPFIGNVSPPVGPWKDNVMIASMGPYRKSTNNIKNDMQK
tara:strand:- start:207 stop:458 length:252 start_codon:yes stop_codon:yes gene_type:complete